MHGVTTALVLFLLVCVVFPNLVKNRPQYYAAFVAVCLIIVLDALGMAIGGPQAPMASFRVFVYVVTGFLQMVAIVMLFLSCGGISWRTMAGDMKEAFEVIRRGGDEKEVIIPLSGEMARMKAQRQAERDEPSPQRIRIDDPEPKPAAPDAAPAPPKPEQGGSLPLEP